MARSLAHRIATAAGHRRDARRSRRRSIRTGIMRTARRWRTHGGAVLHLDIYVVGDAEGWIAVAANQPVPAAIREALGNPRFGWTAEPRHCIESASWPAVRMDLDMDGYSLLSARDLLLPAEPPPQARAA
jgi:hypothetical protein